MKLLQAIKTILTTLLYKLGVRRPPIPGGTAFAESPAPPSGTHGRIGADAVILEEEGRVVLSVGFDFADLPAWVEWDMKSGRLSIAQMAGAVAELGLVLPTFYRERLQAVRRVLLVTGAGPEKLMHYIAFIVRD